MMLRACIFALAVALVAATDDNVTTVAPTTQTPWDSSASLASGSSDSSDSSSGSLDSLNSASFNTDESSGSGTSSTSDSSDSATSSGSTASGSSGFYLQLWQWALLAALVCCCVVAGAGATLGKKKPKKKKSKKAAPAPEAPATTYLSEAVKAGATRLPVDSQAGFKVGDKVVIASGTQFEEFNAVAGFGSILTASPLLFDHAPGTTITPLLDGKAPAAAPAAPAPVLLAPLMPLATTSQLIPSYSMVATPQYQPAYQSYAAPATQSYVSTAPAYPSTYAAPAYQSYAAPMTTSYASAAPAAYSMAPATYMPTTGTYGGAYGGSVV